MWVSFMVMTICGVEFFTNHVGSETKHNQAKKNQVFFINHPKVQLYKFDELKKWYSIRKMPPPDNDIDINLIEIC